MVSATNDPRKLRVSFFCKESDTSKSEIVCEVTCTEIGKINIEYLYHEMQMRTIPGGPWDWPQEVRLGPAPSLGAEIEMGVMHELWSALHGTTRLGTNVREAD